MTQHTTIAGEAHGSLRGYVTGFVLSLVLTAIPFGLVMLYVGSKPIPEVGILVERNAQVTEYVVDVSKAIVLGGIFIAAIIQILVHLHYFLHLDRSSAQRWNLMTLLFTTLVMAIFIGGSLWIMFDLHYRMMG
jgi:cytochrome o ubiquinol oxidase operon protein cyoD